MADKYEFTTRELAELMHKLHPSDMINDKDPVNKLDFKIQKEFLYVGKEKVKARVCNCENQSYL